MNILLATDSYKASHFLQYPPGAEHVSSYIEPRGSNDEDFNFALYVGLQGFIKEYLMKPFTQQDLEEAAEVYAAHGEPFNYIGFSTILDEYNGYMPVEITGLDEGTIVPLSIPLVQIRNTDPRMPWLTSFLETILLRSIWYPTTVATNSMIIRRALKKYGEKSGDTFVDFKLHDFGARGVSSSESAAIGGGAHLMTGAQGTDTVESLLYLRRNYGAAMAGFSIPAAEHSTITTWGDQGEIDAFRNNINMFDGEGKIFAVVSDSYNIDHAIDEIWGTDLYDEVLGLKGTVVIRPDSGDPITEPARIIERLMGKFGYTVNEKGYKVLPPQVRVIQGDGITKTSILQILDVLDGLKLSLDNIAFGMGGGMLQQLNRDTLKFAMKANSITIDGETNDVYKMPQTDKGKGSKAGMQFVGKDMEGNFYSLPKNQPFAFRNLTLAVDDQLKLRYRNGEMFNTTTLEEVRERANA